MNKWNNAQCNLRRSSVSDPPCVMNKFRQDPRLKVGYQIRTKKWIFRPRSNPNPDKNWPWLWQVESMIRAKNFSRNEVDSKSGQKIMGGKGSSKRETKHRQPLYVDMILFSQASPCPPQKMPSTSWWRRFENNWPYLWARTPLPAFKQPYLQPCPSCRKSSCDLPLHICH